MEVAKISTQLPSATLSVPNASLPALAGSLEVEVSTVKAVAAGIEKTIRRTEKALIAVALPKMLSYCAEVFCGADKDKVDEVTEECTEFVVSQFAGIGVPEIREAFKLAAAGKLGEIDLSAYRGVFTIKILGQVLGKYLDFREKVVRELRKAELEAAEAAQEAEKRANMSEWSIKHDDWCKEKIAGWLAGEIPSYECIPVTIYDYLTKAGELNLTKEAKLELMERAKPLVMTSYMRDLNAETNEFRKRSIRTIIDDARRGELSGYFQGRQKLAAKQLAVLDYLTSKKSADNADAA